MSTDSLVPRFAIPVRNMTTPRCAECIEQALAGVEGVSGVTTDLGLRTATVEGSGESLSAQQLVRAIETAGYEVPVTVRTVSLAGTPARHEIARRALLATAGVLEATVGQPAVASIRYWATPDVALQVQRILTEHSVLGRERDEADNSGDQPAPVEAWVQRARWGGLGAVAALLAGAAAQLSLLPDTPPWVLPLAGGGAAGAVLFGAGLPLYVEAFRSLAASSLSFSVYVTTSATVAFLYSLLATVAAANHRGEFVPPATYFDLAALLIAFALWGRLLTARARQVSSESLRTRVDVRERTATLRTDGGEREVPLHTVNEGDRVVVMPGARVPVDGTVTEGESAVDESTVTGESLLVDKQAGSEVTGGAVNRTGRLVVEATRVRGDTVMSQIVKQFRRARGTHLPFLGTSEQLSLHAVPASMGASLLTFLLWLAYGPPTDKLANAALYGVAVLLLGCPCALGFAESLINGAAINRAGQLGVVFKEPESVELASGLSYLLLDKTGTLTLGYPEVVEVVPAAQQDRDRVLALAAAAGQYSDHPVARAILRTANRRKLALPAAERPEPFGRNGAVVEIDGRRVVVSRWAASESSALDEDSLLCEAQRFAAEGKAVMLVLEDDETVGVIGVADPPKPTAEATIRELHALGLRIAMVTGDSRPVAEHLAKRLNLDRVLAEALPGEKTNEARRLQVAGELVGVVGDGFNDAPALAQADVGIAMASGESIALEAADIALTSDDPLKVPQLIRLAARTMEAVNRSTLAAFVCNGLLLPVGLGILPQHSAVEFGPGVVLAAAAAGSLPPLWYALRLRGYTPSPTTTSDE